MGARISPYPGAPASSLLPAANTDVSGSRAKDTVYQNTGTTTRIVIILGQVGSLGQWGIQVGAANPPTVYVMDANVPSVTDTLIAIVPPGYYYRAVTEGGTLTIKNWSEVNL